MEKYTIVYQRYRPNFDDYKEKEVVGTFEELKEYFSYTLKCGRAYQHEEHCRYVPSDSNIEDIDELVVALNNAAYNTTGSQYRPSDNYWLE